jgi:hypothetical protein
MEGNRPPSLSASRSMPVQLPTRYLKTFLKILAGLAGIVVLGVAGLLLLTVWSLHNPTPITNDPRVFENFPWVPRKANHLYARTTGGIYWPDSFVYLEASPAFAEKIAKQIRPDWNRGPVSEPVLLQIQSAADRFKAPKYARPQDLNHDQFYAQIIAPEGEPELVDTVYIIDARHGRFWIYHMP